MECDKNIILRLQKRFLCKRFPEKHVSRFRRKVEEKGKREIARKRKKERERKNNANYF